MSEESWAVAALAIVDRAGTPLTLRTYTSPDPVIQSPEAPLQAHLYVGPEDIVQLHFILFSSLDRCEERREASRRAARAARRPRDKNEHASLAGRAGQNASMVTNASMLSRGEASEVRGGATTTNATAAAGSAVSMSRSFAPDPSRLVTPTTDVRFVGQLMKDFRFASYGFCSVTRITTILVTVGPGEAPQDAMVPLCRAIYECASAALCNPFNTPAQNWHAQQILMAKSAQAWWRREQLRRAATQAAEGTTHRETDTKDEVQAEGSKAVEQRGYETERNTTTISATVAPSSLTAGALMHGEAEMTGNAVDESSDNGIGHSSDDENDDEDEEEEEQSVVPVRLPYGAREHSWRRIAPTLPNGLPGEATLTFSKNFNSQLESILSSFTVTARSRIVH